MALFFVPALLADQGYEDDVAEPFVAIVVRRYATHTTQALMTRRPPDRDQQPTADRELLSERLWDFGATRSDDDGVERRRVGPTFGAVATTEMNMGVAEPLQTFS